MKRILVTGSAGFIGFHLVRRLLQDEIFEVVSIDDINDYYDVNLKYDRLRALKFKFDKIDYMQELKVGNHTFIRIKLEDKENIDNLFKKYRFDYVVNFAAQAGVRYSLINPHAYINSNITGFLNILEGCRHYNVKHLVYASSSSVYGMNTKMPFSVGDTVDHPISLYAATKKSNELMAHTYSHLYSLPTTGLRYFTVYGPWGRPDMALFLFTKAILNEKPIDVYNNGDMKRDFTYIDDIIEGVRRLITTIPSGNSDFDSDNPDPATSIAPYSLYNIGNNSPVNLMDFIKAIEEATGKEAMKNYMPMQPGDVPATYANVDALTNSVNFKPSTPIKSGIKAFVNWYKDYYNV